MKQFLRSRAGIVIITITGLIILIFFQRVGFLRPAENIITTVLKPVQNILIVAATNIKGLTDYLGNIKNLEEENDRLIKDISRLIGENVKLKQNLSDTGLIQEELEFITKYNYRTVTAKVIGRSSRDYLQEVIINKGDSVSIRQGFPVIASGGIIIGKIIDTNSSISKVLLLNDNQSEIGAIIQNNSQSQGVLSGQFGISLRMELIPQNDPLEIGQIVTTSGLEEDIPSGLVIGTITEIIQIEGDLFQKAIIEPQADYQNLSIVTVILPFND
ncbi:rod shape-determining protein MreC [Patescibacteria group bacterium]|nr:rod shape-determining protein MreC [Patescibacteria group bacterium]